MYITGRQTSLLGTPASGCCVKNSLTDAREVQAPKRDAEDAPPPRPTVPDRALLDNTNGEVPVDNQPQAVRNVNNPATAAALQVELLSITFTICCVRLESTLVLSARIRGCGGTPFSDMRTPYNIATNIGDLPCCSSRDCRQLAAVQLRVSKTDPFVMEGRRDCSRCSWKRLNPYRPCASADSTAIAAAAPTNTKSVKVHPGNGDDTTKRSAPKFSADCCSSERQGGQRRGRRGEKSPAARYSSATPAGKRCKKMRTHRRPRVVAPAEIARQMRRRRQRRLSVRVVVAAAAAGLLGMAPVALAQYKEDTALFEENMETAEADLTASLKGGEYVEDVFYPERQVQHHVQFVCSFFQYSEISRVTGIFASSTGSSVDVSRVLLDIRPM